MQEKLGNIKIGDEVVIEIPGKLIFYGVMHQINEQQQSINLVKVRRLLNGQETLIQDATTPVRFGMAQIVKIAAVGVKEPEQQTAPIRGAAQPNPNDAKDVEMLVESEVDLKKDADEYMEKKLEKLRADCEASGKDFEAEKAKLTQGYDAKKSFFDTTEPTTRYGKKNFAPGKSQYKGAVKRASGGNSGQGSFQKGGRNVAKGADGKW